MQLFFLNACSVIRRISNRMCSLSGPQIILRGHIFDTVAQNFVALLSSKPSKNSMSLTILLSCNFKGLVFHFYLNRKRN